MPGPPPNGESSTERCGSSVHRRRSWTSTSITPARRALPSNDWSTKCSTMSGKMVKTAIRTLRVWVIGCRSGSQSPNLEETLWGVDHDAAVLAGDDEVDGNQAAAVEDKEVAGGIGLDRGHGAQRSAGG